MEEFSLAPRPGEVYNLGGGRQNSISVLEAIERVQKLLGRKLSWEYVDQPRKGDHICYISNLTKLQTHYPNWNVSRSLDDILKDLTRQPG
jgi:CDP-paratose 2-epimerase